MADARVSVSALRPLDSFFNDLLQKKGDFHVLNISDRGYLMSKILELLVDSRLFSTKKKNCLPNFLFGLIDHNSICVQNIIV